MSISLTIWYDSEAHNGRGTPTEFNETADILPVVPVDPCVTCEMAASCAANMTDCKAFRTYAATGKFKDSDIARLVKGIK
jgi:hypothetical protein